MSDTPGCILREVQEKQKLDPISLRLHLNHWQDEKKVFVDGQIARHLKRHHAMGIRFLYRSFKTKKHGAILNQDFGMNFPIQVSAFLNAMYYCYGWKGEKSLVICNPEAVPFWYYHIFNHGDLEATLIDELKSLENTGDVIIASYDSIPSIRKYKDHNFACFIVDGIDSIAQKMVLKQTKAKFKVGLTHTNFIKNRNPKTQWTILNWANKGCVGKWDYFTEMDQDHLDDLIEPYVEWWQRLTWKFCDTFSQNTKEEEESYSKIVSEWCSERNSNFCIKKQIVPRKRKLNKSGRRKSGKSSKIEMPKCADEIKSLENDSELNSNLSNVEIVNPITNKCSLNANKDTSDLTQLVKQENEDENSILTCVIEGSPLKTGASPSESFKEKSITKDSIMKDLFGPSPQTSDGLIEENCLIDKDDNNVLLSIIDNKTSSSKDAKTNILSELFQEGLEEESSLCEPIDDTQRDEILSELFGGD